MDREICPYFKHFYKETHRSFYELLKGKRMKSKEAVFEALKEVKNLISSITGIQYTLINEILHTRHSERNDWEESELHFYNPPSWLNLKIIEEKSANI